MKQLAGVTMGDEDMSKGAVLKVPYRDSVVSSGDFDCFKVNFSDTTSPNNFPPFLYLVMFLLFISNE